VSFHSLLQELEELTGAFFFWSGKQLFQRPSLQNDSLDVQAAEQGGFPGAGRPDDDDHFSFST
jgi:hypothetical protein